MINFTPRDLAQIRLMEETATTSSARLGVAPTCSKAMAATTNFMPPVMARTRSLAATAMTCSQSLVAERIRRRRRRKR